MDFDRLFTISAFEGLRLIRVILTEMPTTPLDECRTVLVGRSPEARAYDLEAAAFLHDFVTTEAPIDSVLFYRECVMAVMIREMPTWAKVMTLGRGRFIKSIKHEDYRDIRSVFREADLLKEPPTDHDIRWWDIIKERLRSNRQLETMERARHAEKLSLEREVAKLASLGIVEIPVWMAIEDDTVGYDVLSYRPVGNSVRRILIEVKSTIASPPRFNVSRNEWDHAAKVGDAYMFHIWDLSKSPPQLFEKAVDDVRPHIPEDGADGRWTNVLVPVSI
ncbi:MAG: DUF3883 domain-containing protein [Nitrospiraceae bacterium]|nr:DUF3883 domain-containing protein [Nitrospiraceae bacterium]OQW74175.1 MAG: hypothetical protein BVN33_09200 [Proteobacteria bacterium ST_bin13]